MQRTHRAPFTGTSPRVNTNYLPQVTDLTLFSSDRVKIIPFERHFDENEQDRTLKTEFTRPENLSGILNWCLDGLDRLRTEGFATPMSVKTATESYRHNSDKMGLFMEDSLIQDAAAEVRTSQVYAEYQHWCEQNGFCAENVRNFRALLEGYGQIERKRPKGGGDKTTVLLGYRLQGQVMPL